MTGESRVPERYVREALPEAITALRELLKAEDPRVRLEAARLLVEAQQRMPTSPEEELMKMISASPEESLRMFQKARKP